MFISKTKKWSCTYTIVSKATLKNKQGKLRPTKKDEIKEESDLIYATVISNAFFSLVCLFFIR